MQDKPPFWSQFRSYVGYGVAACVFLVIPLVAIDWLIKTVPFLDDLLDWLVNLDSPGLGVALGLVFAVCGLAGMGWLLRGVLWDKLSQAPIIGTLITSTETLSDELNKLDRHSKELVAWVPFLFYRNLCVVMSRNVDPDGSEYATVYVLSGAGQFQGNSLCNVRVSGLVFPGWTIDEAIVFSSSGGAVIPPQSRSGE